MTLQPQVDQFEEKVPMENKKVAVDSLKTIHILERAADIRCLKNADTECVLFLQLESDQWEVFRNVTCNTVDAAEAFP